MMQQVILNIINKTLFCCLYFGLLLGQCFSMNVGKWCNDLGVDRKVYERVEHRQNKNVVAVATNDKDVVFIESGMFPFSSVPNQQYNELIDYLMPRESAKKAKNLNVILSKLCQIKFSPNKEITSSVLEYAQAILNIIKSNENVLDGTGLNDSLNKKLTDMVNNRSMKSFGEELKLIKSQLLIYYRDYSAHLIEYFHVLQGINANDKQQEESIEAKAILNMTYVSQCLAIAKADGFSDAVAAFQSAERFKNNAHLLVHSENILLYLLSKKSISICNDGIRFFTYYDMCENCEHLVWKYAHGIVKQGNFIVLSKKEFLESRQRNDAQEEILLKVFID